MEFGRDKSMRLREKKDFQRRKKDRECERKRESKLHKSELS